MTSAPRVLPHHQGVIFDLDGVLTDTARVHAAAWKQLFDEYLAQRPERRGEDHRPFTPEDYLSHVDGRPRGDGVESFLSSRGIHLPLGSPTDPPGSETVWGLGNRKNEQFLERLEHDGVHVFDDALALVERLHDRQVPIAVISASRNCERVLRAAGLHRYFAVRVDGVVAEELGLPGKPDPAVFLEAARRLGVAAELTVVIEDARAGVEAGRRGGFGLVVGVDRTGSGGLAAAGADAVVSDLREIEVVALDQDRRGPTDAPVRDVDDVPDALRFWPAVAAHMGQRRPVLFLDFDGTLTPIVDRPHDVVLPEAAAAALRRVAELTTVAVITGRDLRDIRRLMDLDSIWYAGSHGFEIGGPDDQHHEIDDAAAALPDLDRAQHDLESLVGDIPGAEVDRKRFSIATHYRNVPEDRVADVVAAAEQVAARYGFRSAGDRKVVEVQPAIDWHKGRALQFLLHELGLDEEQVVPIFVGDGSTDEDAFASIADTGIGIVVRHHERSTPFTAATFALDGPEVVPALLDRVARLLSTPDGAR